ncbi:MAG: hypothetical protein ACI38V_09390 [Bacteroides sp.]
MKKKILTCGLLLLAAMPALFGQSKRHVLWYDSPAPNGGSVHVIQHRGFPFDSDWKRIKVKCEGTDLIRFATKPHSRYTITF